MRVVPCNENEGSFPIDHPLYRVNFWQRSSPDYGWNLEAFLLFDATDVNDVIQWAEDRSEGRRYEVFVTNDAEEETEYSIRLLGSNPNSKSAR